MGEIKLNKTQRILVMGLPGAGKTYFAERLKKYLEEHYHPVNEMSFRQTIHSLSTSDRGFKVVVDRGERKVLISFDSALVDIEHSSWLKQVEKIVGLIQLYLLI